ncbi:MAG: hypothetical protein E7582_00640 [Ruminococcaceae bacterium]|nr:hypothetical protein [Oscillospiraceae bacterium]
MIWGLFATLGHNMWTKEDQKLTFSENAWNKIVDAAHEAGINTIILDLGEGVRWETHPELAKAGAWGREKIKSEVLRLRDMGIALVPKINLSTCHDLWLGPYRTEISKPVYYQVVRDLINECYDLFLEPEYIHLGMDEEGDLTHQVCYSNLIRYRKGDLLWHDLNWMFDCVRSTGATPWIWADFCMNDFDNFVKNVSTENLLISPWYYFAFKEEHFRYHEEGSAGYINAQRYPYNFMNIKYEEDKPLLKLARENMVPAAKAGYDMVPCTSDCYECEYNTPELFEHIKFNAPEERIKGFMTAPWGHTVDANVEKILKNISLLAEAKKKYYGE